MAKDFKRPKSGSRFYYGFSIGPVAFLQSSGPSKYEREQKARADHWDRIQDRYMDRDVQTDIADPLVWPTILGGWFGLHKYQQGEIGQGILYSISGGLLFYGWIKDSIQAVKQYKALKSASRKGYMKYRDYKHIRHLMPQSQRAYFDRIYNAAPDPHKVQLTLNKLH